MHVLYAHISFGILEKITDLIVRLKASDSAVMEEIFKLHYKFLVYLAYQYIGDKDFSRDIVQDVLLDLWKRRETLEIKNLKAFLKRAVINKSLTAIRNGKNMDFVADISERENPRTDNNVAMEFTELQESIQKTVMALPERCRLIFQMSRNDNLSHKEIAAKLDISTKTIENQISKALKILRRELKKLGLIQALF